MFDWEEPDEYGYVTCSHCAGTRIDPKYHPDQCWVCSGTGKECGFCGDYPEYGFCCDERKEHTKEEEE
jgi:hypothetical protein